MSILKAIWCHIFHRYTGHMGFEGGGVIDWHCCVCGHGWSEPSKCKPKVECIEQ